MMREIEGRSEKLNSGGEITRTLISHGGFWKIHCHTWCKDFLSPSTPIYSVKFQMCWNPLQGQKWTKPKEINFSISELYVMLSVVVTWEWLFWSISLMRHTKWLEKEIRVVEFYLGIWRSKLILNYYTTLCRSLKLSLLLTHSLHKLFNPIIYFLFFSIVL